MIQEPILERNEELNSSIFPLIQDKEKTTSISTAIDSYNNNRINKQVKEQEKEIDDITDLVDKFKYLSLKIPEESGEDALTYGIKSTYLSEKHSLHTGYLYCNDGIYLNFCSLKDKKDPIKLKLKLSYITDFSIGKNEYELNGLSLPIEDKCFLNVFYDDNLKHCDIIMNTPYDVELFIVGIISIIQKKFKESSDFDTDLIYLKRIWKEYDKDHKKYLNINQFGEFLSNINYDHTEKI